MLNNIVAVLRKKAGLTQEELASRVGVTRQTIISIEKGNYTPSLLLAFSIAKVFDMSVDKVFFVEDK